MSATAMACSKVLLPVPFSPNITFHRFTWPVSCTKLKSTRPKHFMFSIRKLLRYIAGSFYALQRTVVEKTSRTIISFMALIHVLFICCIIH